MEEKKSIKISFSTFLIILTTILLIAIFYLYIVQKNNGKLLEQENLKMKKEISSLEKQVNDYRDKVNQSLDVVTGNNNGKLNSSKDTNESSLLTQEEAKKIIKDKFDKIDDMYFKPEKVFQITNKADSKGRYFIEDFERTISKYFTSTAKENFKAYCIIEEDGKYYLVNGGGFVSYNGLKSIENIQISEKELTSVITTKHQDPDGNTIDDISTEIKLIKNGNDWLISNFNWKVFE